MAGGPLVDPARLLAARAQGRVRWRERDVILYALALGCGRDDSELRLVDERGLAVVPAFVLTLPFGVAPSFESLGIDPRRVLHVGTTIAWAASCPAAGEATVRWSVNALADKGAGRPALIETAADVVLADGTRLAAIRNTVLVRDAGGFGGPPALPRERSAALPSGPPDDALPLPTFARQAMLYRLTGDGNPIHIDPAAAREAGLPGPILHGLCTFGMVCRALLARLGDRGDLSDMTADYRGWARPGEALDLAVHAAPDRLGFVVRRAADAAIVLAGHATPARPA